MNRRDSLKGLSAVTAHALFPSVLSGAAAAAAGLDSTGGAWTPQWIRPERAAMLEALVDTIVPATDTPGARQARVQVFVDLALRDCYTPAEQKLFAEGLEALAGECQARHGRPFEACSPEERHVLLAPLDAASYAPDTGARGSFIRILKDLTLVGFFTSRIGATQVLAYEAVPGGYLGCLELRRSGMTGGWAAKELTEAGLRTLVLERGGPVEHVTGYPTARLDPWELPYGNLPTQQDLQDYPVQRHLSFLFGQDVRHFLVKDVDHPYEQVKPFHWFRGYQVGGRSLLWSRHCFRWSDLDFEANLKEGVGSTGRCATRTWPPGTTACSPSSGSVERRPACPSSPRETCCRRSR